MWEILRSSAEYRDWGMSIATIGAMGITFFTFVEGYGLWLQGRKIWAERSGEALSLRWFAYIGSYFVATIPYGIHHISIVMIFSAIVTGLLHIPIIVGMFKFKRLGLNETVQSALFTLMVPAMFITDHKETLYTALSIGTVYSVATQPWEMYKEKSAGVVEIRMIVIYILSGLFWVSYGYALGATALMIAIPPVIFFLSATIVLWYYYGGYDAWRAHAPTR